MSWKTVLLIIPTIAFMVLLLLYASLEKKLIKEEASHEKTQTALNNAVAKGNGWKIAYEEANATAEAHRKATQACFDREVEARVAEQERDAILQAAQPRPRTETEQEQVVDDETRKSCANRLNRPL